MSDRARPESAQLGLPFPHVPRYGAFLPAKSNAAARAWLAQPQEWPQRRLALWGEAGCGKTHLLHLWARAQPAQRQVLDGPDLPAFSPAADIAVDRADQVTKPRALLHLLNSCAEAGCSVVLAGRAAPARWNTGLPDLDSRLRALIAVPIGPPEDTLLEAPTPCAAGTARLAAPAPAAHRRGHARHSRRTRCCLAAGRAPRNPRIDRQASAALRR